MASCVDSLNKQRGGRTLFVPTQAKHMLVVTLYKLQSIQLLLTGLVELEALVTFSINRCVSLHLLNRHENLPLSV